MKRALLLVITLSFVIPFSAQSKTSRAGDEATIYRDEYGIPHVFAQTLEAASYGIGYAQAEDRLEELLKNYRRANGTMAEVVGPEAYRSDLIQRMWRHSEISREKYDRALSQTTRMRKQFLRSHDRKLLRPVLLATAEIAS